MIKTAIILAGGLGTRLSGTVPDLPKCMAPVAGRPFLFYVINALRMQGVEQFVFSLGFRHEVIEAYLEAQFPTLKYVCTIEDEPLGTGGAIRLACSMVQDDSVLVVNGDTLFRADLFALANLHIQSGAECTLALKPMQDFDRYGVVETDASGRVTSFLEKQYYAHGHINGGVYLLRTGSFLQQIWPEKFSFEKDYLEQQYREGKIFALASEGYFIDIGIPEDYYRAQDELRPNPLDLAAIDKSWTLFLDRDGVLNREKKGGYIENPRELELLDGVKGALEKLSKKFGRMVVVTNQRGIGKGIMTEQDLEEVHARLQQEISPARIDAFYHCSSVDGKHPCRKPNPGMSVEVLREFPDTDLSRAIMVGNNLSDMQFARSAGMYAVFVRTTHPDQEYPHPDIDMAFDTLADFAAAL